MSALAVSGHIVAPTEYDAVACVQRAMPTSSPRRRVLTVACRRVAADPVSRTPSQLPRPPVRQLPKKQNTVAEVAVFANNHAVVLPRPPEGSGVALHLASRDTGASTN